MAALYENSLKKRGNLWPLSVYCKGNIPHEKHHQGSLFISDYKEKQLNNAAVQGRQSHPGAVGTNLSVPVPGPGGAEQPLQIH